MKSAEIRQAFLDYFAKQGHEVVASSSLVPSNDATLLFTNAGMVQFKDVFLGREQRNYKRATSSQRVVRAGGKHNDLENVGYTARHHTFFEMLGNFSFGDYFKVEAIRYAWEFLTEVLKLPAERLWVTVFHEDKESEQIWLKEIGIAPSRLSRLGEKDNFWSMGDTGPCGPCTEIFYDHGVDVPGGPPGSDGEDEDRFIEIWNLVFMQYDRQIDGSLQSLPKPSVDTGMGLERIAAVMQGVHNNYEIDLFQALINSIANIMGVSDLTDQSLRVVADHIRSAAFLICDGVTPSNEGRGYVLRRIIRRALRHAHKLGVRHRFFAQCLDPLTKQMGAAYPELISAAQSIKTLLAHEERQFSLTLEQGLKLLEQDILRLSGSKISGQTLFTLYDTYGFPVDLTADIARERGLSLDMSGFEKSMNEQKARSKRSANFARTYPESAFDLTATTAFKGYDQQALNTQISAIFALDEVGQPRVCDSLQQGEAGFLVLKETPCYAESGGQVSDFAIIHAAENQFQVQGSIKQGQGILHQGVMRGGALNLGDLVRVVVDVERRSAVARNHSATHLLHAALRACLGAHVIQKGSLVEPNKLRFDFAHLKPLTQAELESVEQLVNRQIFANTQVTTELMSMEQAKADGALALFDEKYEQEVRVLSMGLDGFSKELCGGTHVKRTADIGFLKIISQAGIASGVRRIEAVTGKAALDYVAQLQQRELELVDLLKVPANKLVQKLSALVEQQKKSEKEIERLKSQLLSAASQNLLDQAKDIGGVKTLFIKQDAMDAKSLRALVDELKNKLGAGVVLVAAVDQVAGRTQLAAAVSQDLTARVRAGDLVAYGAKLLKGKGGGRADFAMAGAKSVEQVPEALVQTQDWLAAVLA